MKRRFLIPTLILVGIVSIAVGCTALLDFDRLQKGHDQGVGDLAGADLTGADLAGADLTGTAPDLYGLDLYGADLLNTGCVPAPGGPYFDPLDERGLPSTPRSLAIADVNGDQKLDLLYGTDSNMIYVQLNGGARSFGPAVGFASGCTLGYNHTILVADFDGDGKNDIVSGCDDVTSGATIDEFAFLKGDGAGAFAAPVQFSDRPVSPVYGITLDLDGDSTADAVVVDWKTNGIAIYWGGKTGFTTQTPVRVGTVGRDPWTIAAAPLGGDAVSDLVVLSAGGSGSGADMATAHGTIQVIRRSRSNARMIAAPGTGDLIDVGAAEPLGGALGNLNGDARPDLVALYFGTTLYASNGAGAAGGPTTFSAPSSIATTFQNPNYLAVGDLDCDGRDDVVLTHYQLTSDVTDYDRFEVIKNTGIGFATALSHTVGMSGAPSADRVQIADLDGDGHPDVAMTLIGAIPADNKVRLLWGRATP